MAKGKTTADSRSLFTLHCMLLNHVEHLKETADFLRDNDVKRAIRRLDNTTEYLAKNLLEVAKQNGMPSRTVDRISRVLNGCRPSRRG